MTISKDSTLFLLSLKRIGAWLLPCVLTAVVLSLSFPSAGLWVLAPLGRVLVSGSQRLKAEQSVGCASSRGDQEKPCQGIQRRAELYRGSMGEGWRIFPERTVPGLFYPGVDGRRRSLGGGGDVLLPSRGLGALAVSRVHCDSAVPWPEAKKRHSELEIGLN